MTKVERNLAEKALGDLNVEPALLFWVCVFFSSVHVVFTKKYCTATSCAMLCLKCVFLETDRFLSLLVFLC